MDLSEEFICDDISDIDEDSLKEFTEETKKELNDATLVLFKSMERQIDSVINVIINFNRAYEREDYKQEAWFGCYNAVVKFSKFHTCTTRHTYNGSPDINNNLSIMQIKTFAFWFIRKQLYKKANLNEVDYEVFDNNNNFVEILSNTEYRKKKKALEGKGYIVKSTNNTDSFSEMDINTNGKKRLYDPAAPSMDIETLADIA